jgi:hypothetical protein
MIVVRAEDVSFTDDFHPAVLYIRREPLTGVPGDPVGGSPKGTGFQGCVRVLVRLPFDPHGVPGGISILKGDLYRPNGVVNYMGTPPTIRTRHPNI